MIYKEIFREAINKIKSKWELPPSGFLAGGSISNVVWNIVTGNDAPINDLDIYHVTPQEKPLTVYQMKEKQHFTKNEKKVYEDYSGLNVAYLQMGWYTIEKVSENGIFNDIEYNCSTEDRKIVIDSFDINCCQLGYDIEKDEFIWTKDFEIFLETGELRLTNLTSPAHSAIRLVKKKNDLNAILPKIELDIICYAMGGKKFMDSQKFRFKERYANMYKKYESELEQYFKLVRDEDVEEYLRNNLNIHDFIWTLVPKKVELDLSLKNIPGVFLSKDFLFYVRNFIDDKKLSNFWFKLNPIIDSSLGIKGYIDIEPNDEIVDKLHRLIVNAPKAIRNLKNLSLSNQLNIFEKVLNKFHKDPFLAISLMESYDLINHNLDDEMEVLLMELTIRRVIAEDKHDKVYKILGVETWDKN
jgi:hypothetical protein